RKLDLLDLGVDPSIVKDDAKLYKTTLYPKKSILGGILGIRSGTVIAYGHLIKPPYYVERKGEEVFINGIRVHPLMSNPNYKIKPKVFTEEETRQYEEYVKTVNALINYYWEVKNKEGKESAIKKLLEFAKRFENIEKIEWNRERNEPLILWKGEKYPEGIMYFDDRPPQPPLTEEERKKAEEEQKKDSLETAIREKKSYEKCLKNNCVKVFDYSGVEIGGIDSDAKESIINIMENPKLSNKEKIKELEILFDDDDIAKSIFYNYDPKEWKE
ncbi:MAG: hypothetical protein AB1630_11860, partial [bacterium]